MYGQQHALCRVRQGAWRNAIHFGVFLEEMRRQHVDVERPLAKAGQPQIDDIETEVKIFAEGAATHFLFHAAIRGGDNADIDLDGNIAADPVDLLFLQGTQ